MTDAAQESDSESEAMDHARKIAWLAGISLHRPSGHAFDFESKPEPECIKACAGIHLQGKTWESIIIPALSQFLGLVFFHLCIFHG